MKPVQSNSSMGSKCAQVMILIIKTHIFFSFLFFAFQNLPFKRASLADSGLKQPKTFSELKGGKCGRGESKKSR